MPKTDWYLAVLVLESAVGAAPSGDPLAELQYRLLRAPDPESAYAKAVTLARSGEHSYANADGDTVRWTFAGLHDLRALDSDSIEDGAEVYSRMVRKPSRGLVVTKDRLAVFWLAANSGRIAREILES